MGIFSKPEPPNASQAVAQQRGEAERTAQGNYAYGQQAQRANTPGSLNNPFGGQTVSWGADGQPIVNRSFSPSMTGSFGNLSNAFGQQTGGLPSGVNFDNATAPAIFGMGVNAYNLANQPLREQQNDFLKTTMAERGLPLGSEISNNEWGNLWRQQSTGDAQALSSLANAIPQNMNALTTMDVTRAMAPGALAGQSLGLLGGMNAQIPQSGVAQMNAPTMATPDVIGAMNNEYNAASRNYQNMWSNIGNAAGGLGGLFFGMPPGGYDFSRTLGGRMTSGLGGLFNGAVLRNSDANGVA